jgi:uncharacterized membrane protein YqjE
VTETVHLNEIIMQSAARARREYELKKTVLAEQERLEAAKIELNEVKVVAMKILLMQGICN